MRNSHSGKGIEPIICKRKSRISADYDLAWGDENAEALFGTFGGGGKILHDGSTYEISAKGPLGRVWTLSNDGKPVYTAERKGLRSSIRIEGENGDFRLERKHMLGNEFRLTDPEDVVAEFEKPKYVTGNSEISVLSIDVDFLGICFAFWLVTTIRRASEGIL